MNRIIKPIKEGFYGVSRNMALALSSISSVTITLLLMGVFLVLSANVQEITTRLEQSVQIYVMISNDFSSEEQIASIQNEISSNPLVLTTQFSSKDEEMNYLIESQGEDAELAEEMYGPYMGENNPMLNSFLVTVKDGGTILDVKEAISQIEGVAKVRTGGSVQEFMTGLDTVRNIGFTIVIALSIIAVFLISNTIRVSIFSRRREIAIMRTVGAGNWYIRWPFIIEGIIIGVFGALIPVLTIIFGYRYVFEVSNGNLLSEAFGLLPVNPLVIEISLVLVALGVLVGVMGSIFSVGRFLRWQR